MSVLGASFRRDLEYEIISDNEVRKMEAQIMQFLYKLSTVYVQHNVLYLYLMQPVCVLLQDCSTT